MNFLLAEYPDEYPAGWYLVSGRGFESLDPRSYASPGTKKVKFPKLTSGAQFKSGVNFIPGLMALKAV